MFIVHNKQLQYMYTEGKRGPTQDVKILYTQPSKRGNNVVRGVFSAGMNEGSECEERGLVCRNGLG